MTDYKRKLTHILIASDFLSETSDFALTRAIEIAKKTKGNLTILHVVQKMYLDNVLDNALKKILPKSLWLTTEEYKEQLVQEKIRSLSKENLNIKYAIIPTGKPPIKILQYAKKSKADLLIMGAHGKYSIRDTFVGTTAEYVVKKTKCPVLIVKNSPNKYYKKILVPVDFSDSSKNALNYTLQLFPTSSLQLIHVGDYQYEELLKKEKKAEEMSKNKINKLRKAILYYLENQMKKFIKGHGKQLNKHPYTIKLGYPGPTILNEAKKFNPDLIIMGTQGHGRIHYLFIGSVANWVLTETDKDILLVPPTK